ncbi:hypothetical protein B0H13DRAFT_2316679 [Mycena leptocephala]|nr:hypothetical protein B0H13DRAFT_2316679 [Mycena leptocephala]
MSNLVRSFPSSSFNSLRIARLISRPITAYIKLSTLFLFAISVHMLNGQCFLYQAPIQCVPAWPLGLNRVPAFGVVTHGAKNRLDRRLRWEGLRPDGPCPSIVVRECIPYTTPTDVDIGINAALNMLPFDLDYWSSPAMLAANSFDPSLPVLTLGLKLISRMCSVFSSVNDADLYSRWAAATACEILISSLISNRRSICFALAFAHAGPDDNSTAAQVSQGRRCTVVSISFSQQALPIRPIFKAPLFISRPCANRRVDSTLFYHSLYQTANSTPDLPPPCHALRARPWRIWALIYIYQGSGLPANDGYVFGRDIMYRDVDTFSD